MTIEWTAEKDAELLRMKAAGMQWSAICPRLGCNKLQGQERHSILTRPGGPAEVRVAQREEPAVLARDGLLWLIRKGRLSTRQRLAAQTYQAAFRDGGEVSIKSCLGEGLQEVHTDYRPGAGPAGAIVGTLEAKRRLFRMRFEILRGQRDMLSVMDGVCGIGWSLRELAGNNDRKAGNLEAVLLVALDLIASDLEDHADKAA